MQEIYKNIMKKTILWIAVLLTLVSCQGREDFDLTPYTYEGNFVNNYGNSRFEVFWMEVLGQTPEENERQVNFNLIDLNGDGVCSSMMEEFEDMGLRESLKRCRCTTRETGTKGEWSVCLDIELPSQETVLSDDGKEKVVGLTQFFIQLHGILQVGKGCTLDRDGYLRGETWGGPTYDSLLYPLSGRSCVKIDIDTMKDHIVLIVNDFKWYDFHTDSYYTHPVRVILSPVAQL